MYKTFMYLVMCKCFTHVKTVEGCLLELVLIAMSCVHIGIFPFYNKSTG